MKMYYTQVYFDAQAHIALNRNVRLGGKTYCFSKVPIMVDTLFTCRMLGQYIIHRVHTW